MIYLVNFANARFYKSQEKLNRSALRFGIDKMLSYREKDLEGTDFYKNNLEILQLKRGAGYWLWKPYFILKAMSKAKKNDVIIYCDCGIELINSIKPLVEICKQRDGIMLFRTHNQFNRKWTKRDCFILMNCDSAEYWDAEQVMGSFSLYLNNDSNRTLMEEWLNYGCNKNILTDIPNICGLENLPEFKEHRHDQSILSLLSVKHKLEIFRNPSQTGNRHKLEQYRHHGEVRGYDPNPYKNSPYDTLLNHHREPKSLKKKPDQKRVP
jgi:hypothetical protein